MCVLDGFDQIWDDFIVVLFPLESAVVVIRLFFESNIMLPSTDFRVFVAMIQPPTNADND